MPGKTRARLEAISDEVKELHPLLEIVLHKLPRVKNVERTHGVNEKGADFVLSRADETFGDLEYIGVIAKIGKISQNFDDIERQIDECALPRTFFAGKHEIRITEVWVITTSTIARNAQDKIHDKFRNRKITFVDGGKLADLVDSYAPAYWGTVEREVGEYLLALTAQMTELDQRLSLMRTGEAFYIEQDVCRTDRTRYHRERGHVPKSERVDIAKEALTHRSLLIEAGMGAGKSKLLRHLALEYAKPGSFEESTILPVTVAYSELAGKYDGSITQAVNALVPEKVRVAVGRENGEYLLLVDGVDEVDATYDQQVEAIRKITAESATGNIRVVVASRYLDVRGKAAELDVVLARYEIRPLTTGRVLEFLKRLCTQFSVNSRITEDLQRSPLFKSLPKSPIAAILLAKLFNENAKELPSNLTELYAKYLELMLGRWDIEKGLTSQKEYQALDHILTDIAVHVIENGLPCVSIAEAKQFFARYLEERNLGLEPEALFDSVRERCDVVVVHEASNTFAFRHRTFAEYLVGRRMAAQNSTHIDERVFDLYWMNTYFFLIGTLRDCPDVLFAVANLPLKTDLQRFVKAIHMGDLLLAGYASRYTVVEAAVRDAASAMAHLYKAWKTDRTQTPLAGFSDMELLWLMQLVFRQSYAYQFFLKAMESAALSVAGDANISSDAKAYALFCLNVAYIDAGATESFDFMLNALKGDLPVEVMLALGHEGERLKAPSALMRKQQRKLHKLRRDNRRLNEYIDALYESPKKALRIGPKEASSRMEKASA